MKKMKKATVVSFVAMIAAMTLLGGMFQDAHCKTEKPIKLTFALFQPATAALSKMHTEYAKEIEERSNGRVQIQIFQSGSLLGAPAMYQGIKNGIADMGNSISSYSPGNFPFTSISELPNANESGWAISHAQHEFLMKHQPKEWQEVQLLTVYSPGCDILGIGTGRQPITKLEDWKGKSLRTNHADIVVALGGTVKDVPMAEVYDAISKGVVDGVVGSTEPLRSWKLGDVTKYVTLCTAPVQPSIMWYNAMNKSKWNSLPSDIKKIFEEVSYEYVGKLGLTWDDQAVAGVEYCQSLGQSIHLLPKEEAARWKEAILPVIDKRLADLTAKGMTKKEIDEVWADFQERVAYWNAQQAKNSITPLITRIEQVVQKQ